MTAKQPQSVIRAAGAKQAKAMLAVIAAKEPGLAAQLTDAALPVLSSRGDVQVQWLPRGSSGTCSVAGTYDPKTAPPTLWVQHAMDRREAFTVLHEYGHHLQQTVDFDLAVTIAEHPEGDRFEEAACESFAALVLLPEDRIGPLTPAKGASAETTRAYYEASQASRTACCIRALGTLQGGGIVAVLDDQGVVTFAESTLPGVFQPAKGSDQSGTALIRKALTHPGETVDVAGTSVMYSTHEHADVLYGQATWIDGWIVAVLKLDNASWRSFSPQQQPSSTSGRSAAAPTRTTLSLWESCTICGENFRPEAGAVPCPVCQKRSCEKGHCECMNRRDVVCQSCWMQKGRAQFDDPDSSVPRCRECTDG